MKSYRCRNVYWGQQATWRGSSEMWAHLSSSYSSEWSINCENSYHMKNSTICPSLHAGREMGWSYYEYLNNFLQVSSHLRSWDIFFWSDPNSFRSVGSAWGSLPSYQLSLPQLSKEAILPYHTGWLLLPDKCGNCCRLSAKLNSKRDLEDTTFQRVLSK